MDKRSIANNLYQVAVINVFVIDYLMLGKKVRRIPPSIQKFDLNETGKLILIVAMSDMMREYLIKQKILLKHINIRPKCSPKNGKCCNADRRSFSQCSSLHWQFLLVFKTFQR